MFADDTIAYITVESNTDSQSLQDDLIKLETWERVWQMEFNPDKCEVLRISRKRMFSNYLFVQVTQQKPKSTSSAKYLGISISNDMNWLQHIDEVT